MGRKRLANSPNKPNFKQVLVKLPGKGFRLHASRVGFGKKKRKKKGDGLNK